MPLSEDILDCMDKGICHHCRKPVLAGQPRYTITECHYECHQAEEKKFQDDLQNHSEKLREVRKALEKLERETRGFFK